MKREIVITDPLEQETVGRIEKQTDFKSLRLKRLFQLPDLTKKENSPVKILFDQIINLPRFKDFDLVEFPKIVSVEDNFDLLNTPKTILPEERPTHTMWMKIMFSGRR